MTFSTSYLTAKYTVDDRALNRGVWGKYLDLRNEMGKERPLEIVELGAGSGGMLTRFLADGPHPAGTYTALDSDPDHVATLQRQTAAWAVDSPQLQVEPVLGLIEEWLLRNRERQVDIVVAHAFLDLFHLPSLIPSLMGLLRPGGLLYATLNFNGRTMFEPTLDVDLDAQIERLYHRSMDVELPQGRRSGSRSGGQLLHAIPTAGGEILAAGGADWVVTPQGGRYPAAEETFLHHILHFFEQSLTGHPDLDPSLFSNWLITRRSQIDRSELSLVAHHLDILAVKA